VKKKLENWSIFDEVIRRTKLANFCAPYLAIAISGVVKGYDMSIPLLTEVVPGIDVNLVSFRGGEGSGKIFAKCGE